MTASFPRLLLTAAVSAGLKVSCSVVANIKAWFPYGLLNITG